MVSPNEHLHTFSYVSIVASDKCIQTLPKIRNKTVSRCINALQSRIVTWYTCFNMYAGIFQYFNLLVCSIPILVWTKYLDIDFKLVQCILPSCISYLYTIPTLHLLVRFNWVIANWGHGTYFFCKYLPCLLQDENLQAKQMPSPLNQWWTHHEQINSQKQRLRLCTWAVMYITQALTA